MEIRNFSEFLLEKKKDKSGSEEPEENKGPGIWTPGSGPWYLEYLGQIKEKNEVKLIKITEQDLLKLGKEGFSKIDSSSKWEKLYQFAKYCLMGKKEDYSASQREKDSLLSKILDIKAEGKTIKGILSKGIKNEDIASYTDSIYSNIKIFIKGLDSDGIEKYFLNTGEELTDKEKKDNEKDLKIIKEFNDTSVISLLAGLYQPEKKSIFVTDSTLNVFKNYEGKEWTDQGKEAESKKKWSSTWSIPVDPLRVDDLIRNSEMAVRQSISCIKQINILFSKENQEGPNKEIEKTEELLKKINDLREGSKEVKTFLTGPVDPNGKNSGTGVIYTFWKNFKAADGLEAKAKLIEGSTGFTIEMHEKFLKNFEDVKIQIQKTRDLIDSGEMSEDEYFANVTAYSKDQDNKSVEIGEGLKKVMYEEIKDGISDLQAAIDNYTSAPGGKNALDQYLKVYNEFIDKTKAEYPMIKEGGKIKTTVPAEVTETGKNKKKKNA